MNKLKSIFISFFIFSLLLGIVTGLFQFISNPSEIQYLAGFLVNLLPLIYFGILYIKKPSKVGGLITIITALVGTTFLISLGRTLFEIQGISLIFVLSLIAFLGWILYILWYSKFKNRQSNIALGSVLTELIFTNTEGQEMTIVPDQHEYHLLLFHRGNWCPLCMAQVRDIAEQYKELNSRKVKVHIISPVNEQWSTKLAAKHQVPFDFLIDNHLRVSKELGIAHLDGLPFGFQVLGFKSDTVLPTVILVDKEMKVLRIHETDDYTKRPEPEFFLRLIDSY